METGDINNERDMRFAINQLLAAAMTISPTGKEQMAFAQLVNNAENVKKSQREIFFTLATALADAVQLGEWPKGEHDGG